MNHPQGRLAVYLPTLVGGGAERVLINLAVGFVRNGFPVDFVVAQCEGSLAAQFPDSVRLVELNPVHFRAGRSIASLPALVRYIRRERPVALLSGLHANIIAIWARKVAGIPLRLVVSEHNTFSLNHHRLPSGYRQLMPWLVRKNYPEADEIVAVSEGVANDLAASVHIARESIQVIPNPVITPELKAKAKEKVDHPWFQPGEPPVVISVGRLTTQKDFGLLIRAFARARKACPSRLVILGEGEDRPMLTGLIRQLGLEQDVSLVGFVSNPYSFMTRASAFVLSSRWEGLPTVLIEALYCGLPVVSTDCPSGPYEILHGGKYGKLVPVGSEEKLAEAIRHLLQGEVTRPPQESWLPYESDTVVNRYLSTLLGVDHVNA